VLTDPDEEADCAGVVVLPVVVEGVGAMLGEDALEGSGMGITELVGEDGDGDGETGGTPPEVVLLLTVDVGTGRGLEVDDPADDGVDACGLLDSEVGSV